MITVLTSGLQLCPSC